MHVEACGSTVLRYRNIGNSLFTSRSKNMSSLPDEYEMETRTSDVVESPDEGRALTESVDNNVIDDTNHDEEYYVITEEDHDEVDLVRNGADLETSATNLVDLTENWLDVCRICANTSDHLIPIFEGEGIDHELSSKIHSHLPIQVSEQDSLPLHLCYHCAATLLAWHELAEGCLDAEQRLLQMQNDSQKTKTTSITNETLNETNIGLKTEESHVQTRNQMSHTSTVEKVDCNEESGGNNIERSLLKRGEITANIVDAIEVLSDGKENVHEVTIDMNYFNEQEEDEAIVFMIPHDETSNDGGRICMYNLKLSELTARVNERSSKNEDYYESSQEILHPAIAQLLRSTGNNFDSGSCDNECASNARLTEHLESHTNESVRICNLCSLSFTDQTIRESHKCLRYNEVTCKDCGVNFKTETSLKDHMKENHGNCKAATTACGICQKNFPNESSLRRHMIKHSNDQPHVCKTCNGTFKRKSSLYMHERVVHQKIKAFVCVICNKKFALKTQLQTHMRVHTGERPYTCDICTRTFKTTSQLQLHKDVHFDNRPFPCDYCEKKFRRRPNLLLHLRTHTGEKPHLCDLCGRGFAQRGDMRRHKSTHFKLKSPNTPHRYCRSSVS